MLHITLPGFSAENPWHYISEPQDKHEDLSHEGWKPGRLPLRQNAQRYVKKRKQNVYAGQTEM
jgi:hypothetical protein